MNNTISPDQFILHFIVANSGASLPEAVEAVRVHQQNQMSMDSGREKVSRSPLIAHYLRERIAKSPQGVVPLSAYFDAVNLAQAAFIDGRHPLGTQKKSFTQKVGALAAGL